MFFRSVFTRVSLRVLFLTTTTTFWLPRLIGETAVDSPTLLDALQVTGRSTDLVGTADSASQGSVGYHELDSRPFLRRGELLEVIPGLVVTQHSGGGKANQYFLRGFNLDHGTDFSVSVDGMPVNQRSHAHGQGYADINFIIPELVQEVNYSKGPFYAEVGDFSAAGAAEFKLFNELPRGLVSVSAGSDVYARLVVANSFKAMGAVNTIGVEANTNNGPWLLPEHFQRFSGMWRTHWENEAEQFSFTALAYHAKWRSSDQIPERLVDAGKLDRFGNVDPTDQGETDRESLSFDWQTKEPNAKTQLTLYGIYSRLNLYSDFTYFLEDPVNGDQFNQRDRRFIFGGSLDRTWSNEWSGHRSETKIGVQVRDDVITELGLFHTSQRVRISTIRDDQVNEGSVGVFAQNETHWNDWFRSTAGIRGDAYRFHVDSDLAENSGNRTAAIMSPKLNLVFGPWSKTEYYLDAGLGFHSNDARGTTIQVDPQTGDPASRVSPLVRSKGLEAGVRTSAIPGLVSSVSIWFLDLGSELVFTGDSGATEASRASRRYGVEFANFYRANSWLTFDADLSLTHARYRNPIETGGAYIANSIGTVVTAGATVNLPSGFSGSIRLRYFGPQPIIEDDSVREPSSLLVNARFGYRFKSWEYSVDALNLLNRKTDDIAYYYTSRLKGEPAGGVDDVHFHPAEPRTVRVSVTKYF